MIVTSRLADQFATVHQLAPTARSRVPAEQETECHQHPGQPEVEQRLAADGVDQHDRAEDEHEQRESDVDRGHQGVRRRGPAKTGLNRLTSGAAGVPTFTWLFQSGWSRSSRR